MSRLKKLWRLVPLYAVMTFLLTGCGNESLSALVPAGPVAREQFFLMKLSLFIMVFVVIVVFAIYLFVLVRYRQRKGQENFVPKQVEGNHVLEIVWTVIPILLLIVLAVPTVTYTFKHSTNYNQNADAVKVKVTAHQFWWQFEYPELGISTAQDLVIPEKKIIAFELTSSDVNHSFWIPPLGGKIDTNPGLTNILYLEADEAKDFLGRCAELCGASHALMNFHVEAKTQADFDAWVTKMKTPAAVPATVQAGEALFKDNCLSCHAISPEGLGLGPNLNGFASRKFIAGILEHNPEELAKWIANPQDQKPGNKMPAFGQEAGGTLNDAQIKDIVKYLETLK